MDFKGTAKRIDDIDLPKLGALIGVGEDELHAFIDVETAGSGFDSKGRPRILFEQHIFFRYLPKSKHAAAKKAGFNTSPGDYGKGDQYVRFMKAYAIDPQAAMYACSWGLGQIMGFNHKLAGYATVEEMITAFADDEENQLAAAVSFIMKANLEEKLRNHDWAGFAEGYNGKNYRINRYDEKLADAYAKWKRIKDTPYKPEMTPLPPLPPAEEPDEIPDPIDPVIETSRGLNLWIFGAILIAAAAVAAYFHFN